MTLLDQDPTQISPTRKYNTLKLWLHTAGYVYGSLATKVSGLTKPGCDLS